MDIAQHLSATLKTLRQQRGWSLSRLAEETGVSKAMLGPIERNESSPTVATPFRAPTALSDMELIAFHAVSAPLLSLEPIADATLPAAPGICDSTPPTAPPTSPR